MRGLKTFFYSGPLELDDMDFDVAAWRRTCLQVYNRNLNEMLHSRDAFIVKCSEEYEFLASQFSPATKTWALSFAAGWCYEAPQVRAVRQARLDACPNYVQSAKAL